MTETCENRSLLSGATVHIAASGILDLPGGATHPIRPNTPVLPYGAASSAATFIDPTVGIQDGKRITLGSKIFVAPFAGLDARHGAIRIGSNSTLLDNSLIVANRGGTGGTNLVTIGERVVVGFGARIYGPSQIGDLAGSAVTSIGANAVIDSATVQPGAIVGAGAVVQPGVTIPTGFTVLPLAVVSSDAEASDPALGKVARVTAADLAAVESQLSVSSALASGYTTLYQGQSVTGVAGSPLAVNSTPGLFNGNLAAVSGTSLEPGSPTVSFEPSRRGPRFPLYAGRTFQGIFPTFPARITGGLSFHQSARNLSRHLGKKVSIRGDEGQPINIGSVARLDQGVTIHAVKGGSLTIGNAFRAGARAVIVGGVGSTIGDDVTVGAGSVVIGSKLGSGVVIGPGAYVSGTTLAPGAVVPAGTVIIDGVKR